MAFFFWDASALAKHYTEELGADTADALFASVPSREMLSTPWGYSETYSILRQRRNEGVLDDVSFAGAITLLQSDVVDNPDFLLMTISNAVIFRSVSMIDKHNLNSTDAALLITLLEFASTPGVPPCVVVSADKRLLRAAENEGFLTLNPETFAASDVPSFLATL